MSALERVANFIYHKAVNQSLNQYQDGHASQIGWVHNPSKSSGPLVELTYGTDRITALEPDLMSTTLTSIPVEYDTAQDDTAQQQENPGNMTNLVRFQLCGYASSLTISR